MLKYRWWFWKHFLWSDAIVLLPCQMSPLFFLLWLLQLCEITNTCCPPSVEGLVKPQQEQWIEMCVWTAVPVLYSQHWATFTGPGTRFCFCCRCIGFRQQQQAGPVYSSIFVVFLCGLQGRKFSCLAVLLLWRAAVPNSFIYDILEESQRKALLKAPFWRLVEQIWELWMCDCPESLTLPWALVLGHSRR